MPLVDLADDTFVLAPLDLVASAVAERSRWGGWWPDLQLAVTRDRGVKGQQWAVRGAGLAGRAVAGTQELWLEPWGDGVVVHYYARLDPVTLPVPDRWVRRERERRARAWKRAVHALKDELEENAHGGQGTGSSGRSTRR